MCGDEFFLGEHRVVESDKGFWVYPRNRGRGRFYTHESRMAESIRSRTEIDPETQARRFKEGTIEPVYYLRDADGKVGIPPENGLAIPDGCTLHEARSLEEVDALAREMKTDMESQYYDDGTATRFFDHALGDPIEVLKQQMLNPVSQMERDVIPLLLEELDRMERESRQLNVDVRFRERER